MLGAAVPTVTAGARVAHAAAPTSNAIVTAEAIARMSSTYRLERSPDHGKPASSLVKKVMTT
jgi:hypothetical protein